MPKLNEVFGISARVPEYTYVDRSGLDARFQYLLGTDKHIVIYGASKQGKTSLRRKSLSEADSVVIPCQIEMKTSDLYARIVSKLGIEIPKETVSTGTVAAKAGLAMTASANIPLFAQGSVSGNAELSGAVTKETSAEVASSGPDDLSWLAEHIRNSGKRVVFEDFHYLDEEEQRRLAFDLKSLWDLGVFIVIVGIWAEQNMLVVFNGDLSGRIEEINLAWTNGELETVLELGESALGIVFPVETKTQMIADAFNNVGLLQRLAEKYCYMADVMGSESGSYTRIVLDSAAYEKTRQAICSEERQRYRQFAEKIVQGFKGYDQSELKVYEQVVRICIDATDDELVNGLDRALIMERVGTTRKSEDKSIRLSDLAAALNKLGRLQVARRISPLVLGYNSISQKVFLVDRELLFYRKYGNPEWPWLVQGDENRQLQPALFNADTKNPAIADDDDFRV